MNRRLIGGWAAGRPTHDALHHRHQKVSDLLPHALINWPFEGESQVAICLTRRANRNIAVERSMFLEELQHSCFIRRRKTFVVLDALFADHDSYGISWAHHLPHHEAD